MENTNWRSKIGKKRNPLEYSWRFDVQTEYVKFAEMANDIAEIYDWDFWGGGNRNYAITISQSQQNGLSISIKMNPSDNYYYYVSYAKAWNPNNVDNDTYRKCIGKNMNEAIDFLKAILKDNFYIRKSNDKRICVMGGAYERYPMELKWAQEEIQENKLKQNI